MGRFCQVCGMVRPNEAFRGRGPRARVCKRCRKLPKAERRRILITDELLHILLEQKNISEKNIRYLESLTDIEDARVQQLRRLVLEIAKVHPRRKRRWRFFRENHPTLWEQVCETGWVAWTVDMQPYDAFDGDLQGDDPYHGMIW